MQYPSPKLTSGRANRVAEPPSLGWMLMLALTLFALALPIVGPLDDHHFAERSHAHQHIYLDGRPASHEHVGAPARTHPHPARSDAPRYGGRAGRTADVVYLTDATASFLLAVMNAPYYNAPGELRQAPPHGDGNNPLTPFRVLNRQPAGRCIAPLSPPPIA